MRIDSLTMDPFSDQSFVERFISRRREYDSVNSCVDEPAILRHVSAITPKTALELGCANGALTAHLARYSGNITAVDRSKIMIDIAISENKNQNVEFICSSFEDLYHNNLFDLVVSGMTMHLIKDFRLISRLSFEWLNQGGYFLFSQRHPIRTAFPSGEGKIMNKHSWSVLDYFDSGYRSYTWLGRKVECYHRSISEITEALISSGFSIADISEPTPQLIFNTERASENRSVPSTILFLCKKN